MQKVRLPNNCVQATPGCACCEFLSQVPDAPDADRWTEPAL